MEALEMCMYVCSVCWKVALLGCTLRGWVLVALFSRFAVSLKNRSETPKFRNSETPKQACASNDEGGLRQMHQRAARSKEQTKRHKWATPLLRTPVFDRAVRGAHRQQQH
jgi:hypothetical protein